MMSKENLSAFKASAGSEVTAKRFREAIDSGDLLLEELSLRMLWEVFDQAADFQKVVGEIAFARALTGFRAAAETAEKMVRRISTTLNGEETPAGEGVKNYVRTPNTAEFGLTIGLTKEAVFLDSTQQFLKNCYESGWKLGYNKTKRILCTVLGLNDTYCNGGVHYRTYGEARGPLPRNLHRRTLEGVEDVLHAAKLLQNAESLKQIFVLPARLFHARRAAELAGMYVPGVEVLTSPIAYQLLVNSSASSHYAPEHKPIPAGVANVTWWAGDFPAAFAYMENWPLTMTQAPPPVAESKEDDILVRLKFSERGTPAVLDPSFVHQFGP